MEIPSVDFTFLYLFLFFAIPGLVFRKLYYQGEFSKQFISKNWAYTLTTSFLLGIIIQFISFYSVKGFFQVFGKPQSKDYIIKLSDFNNVKEILQGLSLYDFNIYDKKILIIVCYTLLTSLISFLLALASWHFVRRLKLDRKFKLLRFGNIWNYYLRGEIIDFKDFVTIKENKKVLLTLVDIVMSDGFSQNKLFSGVLTQYTIDSESNNLETVTLTDAFLWKKDKIEGSPTFGRSIKTEVKGHCLILDVKKSIDLNLTYVYGNEVNNSIKTRILSFVSLMIILFYLIFLIIIIVSSDSLFVVSSSIFYTILLKVFSTVILTLLFTVFLGVIDYIQTHGNWSVAKRSEHRKGVFIIIIFTGILMAIYRLIRYSDFVFWSL